jgi:[NiFe] hydrogenase diaphorase moiety large subunit
LIQGIDWIPSKNIHPEIVEKMSGRKENEIIEICSSFRNERSRLLDILRSVQKKFGAIDSSALDTIANAVDSYRVEVEGAATFYAFISGKPKGKFVVRLCNDIIDRFRGFDLVAKVLKEELGIGFGETTEDGLISLETTPCIGMCDQAPAMLINEVVFTRLSSDRAREIASKLLKGVEPKAIVHRFGDGANADPLVMAMVDNNIRKTGPVILNGMAKGAALENALAISPAEVIRAVKNARLRGRGGAGFPTGMKWEFTRAADGERKVIICNADEGEPGTFKDRVILTERPDLMIEGMTIGGYAIGAKVGIIYLRAEYEYLKNYLESVLEKRRLEKLLGTAILSKDDFDFDIRIQMGAGAYVCGEETALISSCEGKRGDPKNRPPFPAQKGYLNFPTSVNNCETLCCAARILERGAAWFSHLGTDRSSGTKLLSISGDCKRPGVYEVSLGIGVREMLSMCGGENAAAVQIGGPSGQMIGPNEFERTICYDDLATGGAVMVFGPDRDILEVVDAFLEFFVEESCGYCTPCRAGNVLLKKKIEDIRNGFGDLSDLDYLENLGNTIRMTSRCGLGQTSPNPVLSTLKNFRTLYESRLRDTDDGLRADFNLNSAVQSAAGIAGRESVHRSK